MVLFTYSNVNRHRAARRAFRAVTGFINKLHKMSANIFKKCGDEVIAEFNVLSKNKAVSEKQVTISRQSNKDTFKST